MKKHHLSHEELWQISALYTSGKSAREIAKQLGCAPSTITRILKIAVNSDGYFSITVIINQRISSKKKSGEKRRKLEGDLWNEVSKRLKLYHSPEQISGKIKLEEKGTISFSTIYRKLHRDKSSLIVSYLRHSGKKYQPKKPKCHMIPNRVDIDQRPEIANNKARIGDWEADTIIGKNHQGVIVSLVDRKSKYTKLRFADGKFALSVSKAIANAFKGIKDKVKTITYDNGGEFAGHEKVSKQLGSKAYFAKPYHSWERGLNEHTNGLVRQFFPKKQSINISETRKLQIVEDFLNNRPRKVLGYKTPNEIFTES